MTNKRYTDEEIIKALDICTQQDSSIPCCDCPCWNDDEQECEVIDDTVILDIINSQKSEIERLKKARLKQAQFLAEQKAQKYELINKLSQVKTESYKEFAERLKEKSCDIVLYGEIVTVNTIDNLLKEMVGDEE